MAIHYHASSTVVSMIDQQAFVAARKAAGLSQPELARLAKCSQQLIGAIETGDTRSTKFLPRIAAILNVSPSKLDADFAGLAAAGLEESPPVYASPNRDFPIYASAEGGPGQIIRSADPVDFAPRPAPLSHVKGAYGLIVTGDSMVPEYRPGDTALVNPHLPPIAGEVHIFYAEKHGEARATIKFLRRPTGESWLVSQWNPPPEGKPDFALSRKEWSICHRVLGKYSRQ